MSITNLFYQVMGLEVSKKLTNSHKNVKRGLDLGAIQSDTVQFSYSGITEK